MRAPDRYLGVDGRRLRASRSAQILAARRARCSRSTAPTGCSSSATPTAALGVIVAKRLGIPVFHMEAGNRCFDDRVPEEVNRRVIDHSSDVLLPYTERSRENLLREGFDRARIFVTGNPIKEVLDHHDERIDASDVLGRARRSSPASYLLVTVHRQETVDVEQRLRVPARGRREARQGARLPLVFSVHPRTPRAASSAFGARRLDDDVVRPYEPFGFFDFVALERNARCVLTDSGTVQEECCIFGVPTVTVRDTTERPETVECGSNILSGVEPEGIRRCLELMLDESAAAGRPPPEYLVDDVSATVANIVL